MEQDYNITPSGYIYGRDPKSTVPFWNVDTLKSLNEEIDKLNIEINNLELEIDQLENEKQNLQNTINSLNSRIQQLESEKQELQNTINSLNSQIQQLQTEKQNLTNQINDLNNQVSTLESEKSSLQNEITNFPNRFIGYEPFPEGFILNCKVPSNWENYQINNMFGKFNYITCDNINIDFYENSMNKNTFAIFPDINGCNINYLNLLYPKISQIQIWGTYSKNNISDIHKVTLKTKWDFTKYLNIRIPIKVKENNSYYKLNQSIFEIKMENSSETPYFSIECDGNSSANVVNFSHNCIIFNYGNQVINSPNITLSDELSDSSGISSLLSSGLTFFISDQNYDIYKNNSTWSQLGNNLRRLSEYVESEWIS